MEEYGMAAPSSSSSCASVVFLITGASKGLGKAIATVASNYYSRAVSKPRSVDESDNPDCNSNGQRNGLCCPSMPTVRFVLVARSSKGLEETKQEVLSSRQRWIHNAASAGRNEHDIICRPMDLSDLDRLNANIDILLDDVDRLCSLDNAPCTENHENRDRHGEQQQHKVVFINNAGSLGHLGPCISSPSLEDMRRTIDFNVTSSLWLSVRFARHLKEHQESERNRMTAATVVNLSSLVAVSDEFLGMGIYSAGKAARERYHTLLAKEEWNDHNERQGSVPANTKATVNSAPSQFASSTLKILNYAPGPLETKMTKEIRGSDALDSELQADFEKPLLDPRDSALKLIRLLEEGEYFDWESGAHVDYYDLPDSNDKENE